MIMINGADTDHVGADYFNSCNNLDLSRLPYFQAFGDILGGIGSDCSYIDEESLLKTYKTGINKFLVLSQNLQSIGNKLNKIMTSLDNYHKANIFPDLLCYQEVWNAQPASLSIPGYNHFFKQRERGIGGGVAFYLKNCYNCKILKEISFFSENTYESLALQINIPGGQNLIFLNIYRPPSSTSLSQTEHNDLFFSQLNSALGLLSNINSKCFVVTDSNINLMAIDSDPTASRLTDLFSNFSYVNLITKATRISNQSSTCIDQVWTDSPAEILRVGVNVDSISDHFVNVFSINLNTDRRELSDKTLKRKFNETNINKFKSELSEVSWEDTLNTNDTDLACETF